MTHVVTLHITKKSSGKTMTELKMHQWLNRQFKGSDYGQMTVISIDEEPDCTHDVLEREADIYRCQECGEHFEAPSPMPNAEAIEPMPTREAIEAYSGQDQATEQGYDKLAKGWVGTDTRPSPTELEEPDSAGGHPDRWEPT